MELTIESITSDTKVIKLNDEDIFDFVKLLLFNLIPGDSLSFQLYDLENSIYSSRHLESV